MVNWNSRKFDELTSGKEAACLKPGDFAVGLDNSSLYIWHSCRCPAGMEERNATELHKSVGIGEKRHLTP